jgi:hypothetical protein
MERQIEAHLNSWLAAVEDADPEVRDAAAYLLEAVHHHERKKTARSRARSAAEYVQDRWRRSEFERALTWAGKWATRDR